MNVETAPDVWKPVDRNLVQRGDGSAGPALIDGQLGIPRSLRDPIELSHDGVGITMQLVGAAGKRRSLRNTASFVEALPGVTASYETLASGYKERLLLRDPTAPRKFVYVLNVPAGAHLVREGTGAVAVITKDGRKAFTIAAPLAWDSAEPAAQTEALELSPVQVGARRWTLSLSVDQTWLDSPERIWPVTVDPDVTWTQSDGETFGTGATSDCGITNATATPACSSTILRVGISPSQHFRALLKFDLRGVIPAEAKVQSAELGLYVQSGPASVATKMHARPIVNTWNSSATWTKRDASTNWRTAGGDLSSEPDLLPYSERTGALPSDGSLLIFQNQDHNHEALRPRPQATSVMWRQPEDPGEEARYDGDSYLQPNEPKALVGFASVFVATDENFYRAVAAVDPLVKWNERYLT